MYHASDSANPQGGCYFAHSATFDVILVRAEFTTVISLPPSNTAAKDVCRLSPSTHKLTAAV